MAVQARPVILDSDPGVDDALGILLAVRSPEVDLKAVTVCAGNVGLDQCALNALKTLRVAGASPAIPVARGAVRPLRRSPFRAPGTHGPDGLGDVSKAAYPNPPARELDARHAVEVIVDLARAHPDAREDGVPPERCLTIVATGPLTNIALAISADPGAMRRVGRIIWMGGAYATHGNATPVAEFNAFCDPDAAQEVLSFGVPTTVIGLDASLRCPLMRDDLRQIMESSSSPVARYAWAISQFSMDFRRDYEGVDGCYLHDPLAVGLAIQPTLTTCSELHRVHVVTEPGVTCGMTVIDRRPRHGGTDAARDARCARRNRWESGVLEGFGLDLSSHPVEVVFSVDRAAFLGRFASCLS
ncbi:MAG: nucleoside hydrolase [Armatimonadota bacterium]